MTTVALLADPPREGLVLPRIVEGTPLSAAAAADLYEATLRDAVQAVGRSGADLLVNYRPDDLLPAEHRRERTAETELRGIVEGALGAIEDDPHVDDPRFEVQVGSSFEARVGNAVTHLLETEGVNSAAVVRPTAPLVGRTEIDGAAMKLRNAAVVLGPSPGGRTFYAGFGEPIDFAGAYDPPELESITDRAVEDGLSVDFTDTYPTVETPADLASTVSVLRARMLADRRVPDNTARFVLEEGLAVEGEEPAVVLE